MKMYMKIIRDDNSEEEKIFLKVKKIELMTKE